MGTKQVTQKGCDMMTRTVRRTVTACAILGMVVVAGHAQEGTLDIPAGQTSVHMGIQTIDNTIAQRDRDIMFQILPGELYAVAEEQDAHTYTILDNDMPEAGFVPGLPTSGNREDGHRFYVSLTGATSADYPVLIEVSATGSAQEGVHYELNPVEIPAGQAFQGQYEIARILPAALRGGERTLELTLSGDALDFDIGDGNHAYTLLADDNPTVRLETYINGVLAEGMTSQGNEGDEDEIEFRLVMDTPWDEPITVNYQTLGTAQEGTDFEVLELKSVTFLPGETEKTVQ